MDKSNATVSSGEGSDSLSRIAQSKVVPSNSPKGLPHPSSLGTNSERLSYLQSLAQSETMLDNLDLEETLLILKVWLEEIKDQVNSPLLHSCFDFLSKIPLTIKLARQSQIGSYINSLVKQAADADIRERARLLVQQWKNSLKVANTKDTKPGQPSSSTPASPTIENETQLNPKKRPAEGPISVSPAKKPKTTDPSSPTLPEATLPAVIVAPTTKKKSVSWAPEGKLEQVRIFKKDRKPGRAGASSLQTDAQQERFILIQNKKREEEEWFVDVRQMRPKMQWIPPKPLNLSPSQLPKRGENSQQILWQDKYVNESENIAFYIKDSDIPPTPREQYLDPLKIWSDSQILNIPFVRQYVNPRNR